MHTIMVQFNIINIYIYFFFFFVRFTHLSTVFWTEKHYLWKSIISLLVMRASVCLINYSNYDIWYMKLHRYLDRLPLCFYSFILMYYSLYSNEPFSKEVGKTF